METNIEKLKQLHYGLDELYVSITHGLPESVKGEPATAIREVQSLIEKLVDDEKRRRKLIKG